MSESKGRGKGEDQSHETSRLSFDEEKRRIIEKAAEISSTMPTVRARMDFEQKVLKAPAEILDDREAALACVKADGFLLRYFGPDICGDAAVVATAAQRAVRAMRHASDSLRADKDFMLGMVKRYENALEFASDELRGDRNFVLEAVKSHGQALTHASQDLQLDREIVLAAVREDGRALQHVNEDLKGDREIVIAAGGNQAHALQWASEDLRADQDVVIKAVKHMGVGFRYASPSLKANKDFMLLAARSCPYRDQAADCYSEMDANIKEVVTNEEFMQAAASLLATPGEDEPVVTVRLSSSSTGSDSGKFLCEAHLLSGSSFTCEIPCDPSRPPPTLNDLAAVLLQGLQTNGEVPQAQRLFITFARGEDENEHDFVSTSAWDWCKSLRDFC